VAEAVRLLGAVFEAERTVLHRSLGVFWEEDHVPAPAGVPEYFEISFGMKDDAAGAARTGGGRSARRQERPAQGRIDRIDRLAHRRLAVWDYRPARRRISSRPNTRRRQPAPACPLCLRAEQILRRLAKKPKGRRFGIPVFHGALRRQRLRAARRAAARRRLRS